MSRRPSVAPPPPTYPPLLSRTSMIQVGYSVWANLVMISQGMTHGFSAVAIQQIEETKVMTLSLTQTSVITSGAALMQPVGCVISGFITDRYGRKLALLFTLVPAGIGWLLIGFANSPALLILGRFVNGVGAGSSMGAPRTYVTEIALPNVRGLLGGLSNTFIAVGVIMQAQMGSLQFHWQIISFICAGAHLVVFVSYMFMPESPYYLMLKRKPEKALATLRKFRAKDYPTESEMDKMLEFQRKHDLHRMTPKELVRAVFMPKACKPYWIMMIYWTLGQFSGVAVATFWSIQMLQESKSSVNPYFSNVLLAWMRCVGGCLSMVLLYVMRKRPLAMMASTGCALSFLGLGLYIRLTPTATVYPQLFYMSFFIFASLGFFTLPFLMMFELFPGEIRGLLGGLGVSYGSLMIFTAVQLYPFVRELVSLSTVILFFSFVSTVATLYLYLFLPETKDRPLQVLERLYADDDAPLLVRKQEKRLASQQAAAAAQSTSAPAQSTSAPTRSTSATSQRTSTVSLRQAAATAQSTSAPAQSTSAPAQTTSAPARSTSATSQRTSTVSLRQAAATAQRTSAPAQSTSAPAQTTSAPAQSTSAPAQSTSAPAQTTSAPAQSTSAPAQSTSATSQTSTAENKPA